jgi:hypothetical protein
LKEKRQLEQSIEEKATVGTSHPIKYFLGKVELACCVVFIPQTPVCEVVKECFDEREMNDFAEQSRITTCVFHVTFGRSATTLTNDWVPDYFGIHRSTFSFQSGASTHSDLSQM